jgi:hypothetical protein
MGFSPATSILYISRRLAGVRPATFSIWRWYRADLLRHYGYPCRRVKSIILVRDLFAAAGGLFLLAGMRTPVVAALIAADEFGIAFSVYGSPRDGQWTHILLAVLTAARSGRMVDRYAPFRPAALRYRPEEW